MREGNQTGIWHYMYDLILYLCIMCYTVCYLTGIFYAVVRQISVLFIDNKKKCILYSLFSIKNIKKVTTTHKNDNNNNNSNNITVIVNNKNDKRAWQERITL